MGLFSRNKPDQTQAPQNSQPQANSRIIRTLKTDLYELEQNKEGGGVSSDTPFVRMSKPSFPEPQEQKTALISDAPKFSDKILVNPFTNKPTTPESTEDAKGKKPGLAIKAIHTYTSDVAESFQKDKTTLSDVVQAENRKRAEEQDVVSQVTSREHRLAKNAVLILVSALLIAGGAFTLYTLGIFQEKKTAPVTSSDVIKSDLFKFDLKETVSFIGEKRKIEEAIVAIAKKPLSEGQIKKIVFTKKANGATEEATTQDFLKGLEIERADLQSALLNPLILGVHQIGSSTSPFIIVKARNAEEAYLSMLKWEREILKDIQNVFLEKADRVLPPFFSATGSGYKYEFTDGAIQSKDIRWIKDGNGKALLLYGFLDQENILITTNTTTFREVFSRLTKARYTQ